MEMSHRDPELGRKWRDLRRLAARHPWVMTREDKRLLRYVVERPGDVAVLGFGWRLHFFIDRRPRPLRKPLRWLCGLEGVDEERIARRRRRPR